MWTTIIIGIVISLVLNLDFFDHNFAGKPWVAQTNAEETYTFELKVETLKMLRDIVVPFGKSGKTTEAKGMMRNIKDSTGATFVEDGEHNFPFWSCDALQKVLRDIRSGWQELEYVRTFELGENEKGEEVEINDAGFRIPGL